MQTLAVALAIAVLVVPPAAPGDTATYSVTTKVDATNRSFDEAISLAMTRTSATEATVTVVPGTNSRAKSVQRNVAVLADGTLATKGLPISVHAYNDLIALAASEPASGSGKATIPAFVGGKNVAIAVSVTSRKDGEGNVVLTADGTAQTEVQSGPGGPGGDAGGPPGGGPPGGGSDAPPRGGADGGMGMGGPPGGMSGPPPGGMRPVKADVAFHLEGHFANGKLAGGVETQDLTMSGGPQGAQSVKVQTTIERSP